MAFEAEPEEPRRDDTATEPPADEPPGDEHDDGEEPGGPYGNPESDEETLRKQQEESGERGDSA